MPLDQEETSQSPQWLAGEVRSKRSNSRRGSTTTQTMTSYAIDWKASYRHLKKEKELFRHLIRTFDLKTDQDIARFLYTTPSIISQIRNDKIHISAKLILRVYDKTTLTIEEIRKMAKKDVSPEY